MSSLSADPIPLAIPSPPASADNLFEIIDGRRVELPPMSIIASLIASQVLRLVGDFVEAKTLGRAVMEGLFHLPLPVDRNRRPDVAYVSFQRWPRGRPIHVRDNAWDAVPELTVEVISPSDLAEELMVRLDEYFRAGVHTVWVIYPALRTVFVYDSLTSVRGLASGDEIDGGTVLPGFRQPVSSFFPEAQDA